MNMKLDQEEKGALIFASSILLAVFAGMPYEGIRLGTSTLAAHWGPVYLGLMLLGIPIAMLGGWITYSTPMLGHK